MYCPNCGKENSAEQKFCRRCGLSLEQILQSLAEQLPSTELDKNLRDRQRRIDRWFNIAGGSALSIVVGAVLWGIIYEIIIVKGEVLAGSLFLAFIVALILLAVLGVYADSLRKKAKRELSPPTPTTIREGDTARLLSESRLEPIASVTERTTELLPLEKKNNTE